METLPLPTWWRLYSITLKSLLGIALCVVVQLPAPLNRLLLIVIVMVTFRAILCWLNLNAAALEVEDARQCVIEHPPVRDRASQTRGTEPDRDPVALSDCE